MLRRRQLAAIALSALLALVMTPANGAVHGYDNPVTAGYSVDFPDPAVIKAKDGYWYGFSTGGPYDKQGQTGDSYKIARSKDLISWERIGSVFNNGNRPVWADPTSGFWAPDIRYFGGGYVLYFTVHNTTLTPGNWDYAIGVATAPTPAGPWTDSGKPVVAPRPAAGGGYEWTIDPAAFVDTDGQRYLYWGSYNGGIHAVRLAPDGLTTTGPVTQVASDRFEGAYVVRHGAHYYLFGSSANCCAGATTGYAVFAGRSTSPLGPFTDREGASLLASRGGGTPVVFANGNRWVGTGHSSMVTDLSGQQWLAYHGVDRTDPYVAGSNGWLLRPMLLDRLDWIKGWPVVNAGAGPTEHAVRGPVTEGLDPHRSLPSDVRVEADVRGTGPVGVTVRSHLRAVVDHGRMRLLSNGRVLRSVALPPSYDASSWNTLVVETRGRTVTVELSDDRLAEPHASFSMPVSGPGQGAAGVVGSAINFSVAALYQPVTRAVPEPRPGTVDPAYSDAFGNGLGAGWTWRNVGAGAVVADGALSWPTETNDLTSDETASKAALLLRPQPAGSYVIETRLSLDVGTGTVRNFQQAGIVVYVDDQNWLRLDHVAGGNGRFVEFGKRMRFTPVGVDPVVTFGGAFIGPPATTTWLRIAHDLVPGTGEHRYRAGSSTDGRHWVWGAAWTLPADSNPRIGLVSQGSTPEAEAQYGKATARFDYFNVLR